MSVALIMGRIAAAVAGGELAACPDAAAFKPITTMADLLQPWEELFPGVDRDEDGRRGLFDYGDLRRPHLTPSVRRSFRPLPLPRPIQSVPRTINPGLFLSVQATWEFYQLKGLADAELLLQAFDDSGFRKFIEPLYGSVWDYWNITQHLEWMLDEVPLHDMKGIPLLLPHYTHEEECAGYIEAMLSEAEGMDWWLRDHCCRTGADGCELPTKDLDLIAQVGFEDLIKVHAGYQGKKSWDLARLLDWYNSFFGAVKERFPRRMAQDWPIITGDTWEDAEVIITSSQDIEFAIAYSEAYYELMSAIPDPTAMECNQGGEADTFIHELCEVWRKVNRKRSVKWISPKSITIANRIRIGEL